MTAGEFDPGSGEDVADYYDPREICPSCGQGTVLAVCHGGDRCLCRCRFCNAWFRHPPQEGPGQ